MSSTIRCTVSDFSQGQQDRAVRSGSQVQIPVRRRDHFYKFVRQTEFRSNLEPQFSFADLSWRQLNVQALLFSGRTSCIDTHLPPRNRDGGWEIHQRCCGITFQLCEQCLSNLWLKLQRRFYAGWLVRFHLDPLNVRFVLLRPLVQSVVGEDCHDNVKLNLLNRRYRQRKHLRKRAWLPDWNALSPHVSPGV
jgi:hypothetical protein